MFKRLIVFTLASVAFFDCGSDPFVTGREAAAFYIQNDFGQIGTYVVEHSTTVVIEKLPSYCKDLRGACYVERYHLIFVEDGKDFLFYCIALYHEWVHGISSYINGTADVDHQVMGDSYYKDSSTNCLKYYLENGL